MFFAIVNQTSGQVVAPFNSESSARFYAGRFPADHDILVLPLYPSVDQAVANLKAEG